MFEWAEKKGGCNREDMKRGAHNHAVAAKMKLKALPATFSSVTPLLVAELLCLQSASSSASASEQVQKNKEVESMNPKPNREISIPEADTRREGERMLRAATQHSFDAFEWAAKDGDSVYVKGALQLVCQIDITPRPKNY